MADAGSPLGLGGSLSDLVSTIKGAVQNLSQIATVLGNAFPRVNGTFTFSAATTTLVANTQIGANSIVTFSPTNATAALIQRTNGLFHLSNTPGTGFTLSTQSGSAVAGGTFEYVVKV